MQWEVLLAIHGYVFWMDEQLDMDAWTRSTLKGDEFQVYRRRLTIAATTTISIKTQVIYG